MEGRIWAMLAAFLFIACFAALVSYYFEIDSKRRDLSMAQADLKASQHAVANTQSQADTARRNFEEIASVDKMIATKRELTAAIETLRKKREIAVGAYKKTVQDVRNAAIGTAWPEFTHGSQTLRGAKIQKITDTEVTFAHDEGVAKLNKDNMPDAVRDRFRIELFPMLPEPPPAPPMADNTMPQPPSALASEGGATPAAEGGTTAAKLQVEIDAFEQRLSTLSTHRREWLSRAASFRSQASTAIRNGRPSYAFNQQAQQAEQNADLVNAQIEKIQREILELKRKQFEPAAVAAP